ncbi:MAG: hypothetical protein HQ558_02980 [Candidatus Omnitrophica bacterium]|nr:hypothetical protein [Candidatus Omnitrophota bacterium]
MKKGVLAVLVIVVLSVSFSAVSVYADETQAKPENKAVRFFKNIFNWPFGITKKTSEAVGYTVKDATMTVTTTGSSSVEMVTGKPEKIKDVIVTPVKGSLDTGYTAVTKTVKAPIEGTKDSFKKR